MSNDLIKNTNKEKTLAQQEAERIYNIDNIGTMKADISNYYFQSGIPGLPGTHYTPVTFSDSFYNLIICEEIISQDTRMVVLNKRHCLVEDDNIEATIKERFSSLTPEVTAEILSFPCIFANRNAFEGRAGEQQYAVFARLTKIESNEDCIKLYFLPYFAIPQSRLSLLNSELGICGKYGRFNEWNHCHWTIKAKNLRKVINEAGLNLTVSSEK